MVPEPALHCPVPFPCCAPASGGSLALASVSPHLKHKQVHGTAVPCCPGVPSSTPTRGCSWHLAGRTRKLLQAPPPRTQDAPHRKAWHGRSRSPETVPEPQSRSETGFFSVMVPKMKGRRSPSIFPRAGTGQCPARRGPVVCTAWPRGRAASLSFRCLGGERGSSAHSGVGCEDVF